MHGSRSRLTRIYLFLMRILPEMMRVRPELHGNEAVPCYCRNSKAQSGPKLKLKRSGMSDDLSLRELLSDLESRIEHHRERKDFHAGQEDHHRDRRTFHETELEAVLK